MWPYLRRIEDQLEKAMAVLLRSDERLERIEYGLGEIKRELRKLKDEIQKPVFSRMDEIVVIGRRIEARQWH